MVTPVIPKLPAAALPATPPLFLEYCVCCVPSLTHSVTPPWAGYSWVLGAHKLNHLLYINSTTTEQSTARGNPVAWHSRQPCDHKVILLLVSPGACTQFRRKHTLYTRVSSTAGDVFLWWGADVVGDCFCFYDISVVAGSGKQWTLSDGRQQETIIMIMAQNVRPCPFDPCSLYSECPLHETVVINLIAGQGEVEAHTLIRYIRERALQQYVMVFFNLGNEQRLQLYCSIKKYEFRVMRNLWTEEKEEGRV